MITPSFGLTATERVLPKLALDFTTASLDNRITFTRTLDTATVINSNGNIAPINANLPRFDYNLGTGGVCKGLLIEESRTNFLLNSIWSGAITGAPGTAPTSWVATATGNPSLTVATSLYGNADGASALILSGVATERLRYSQTFTAVSGTTYVVSVYVESVTGSSGKLLLISGVAGTEIQTVTNPGSAGKYSYIWTASANGLATLQFGLGTSAGLPNTCTIKLSRIQLEAGAFATSYIPTTLLAVTRNADVATMTGTNFSSWYNASEGAFKVVVQRFPEIASITGIAEVSDGTAAERMRFFYNSATQTRFEITDGGSSQALIATSISSGAIVTMTAGYKLDNFAVSSNGGSVGTDTAGTLPTVNKFNFNIGTGSSNLLCGWFKQLYYWPQRIINAEVQAFSK